MLKLEEASILHVLAPMKFHIRAAMLAMVLVFGASAAHAGIISLGLGSFGGATVETFNDGVSVSVSFNYASGLSILNTDGESDLHNSLSNYGMGTEPDISNGGRGGPTDGYFGTGETPTTFQLTFGGGISQFGFYGAESSLADGSLERNGQLNIDFYDVVNNLLGSVQVSTAGTFAWDQFHGFASDGALIDRVVFLRNGHMVLDDVMWGGDSQPVPEPATLSLLGLGLVAAGVRRYRRRSV